MTNLRDTDSVYGDYPDLLTIYQQSFYDNFTLPALTDYGGKTMTYGELGRRIARLHILLYGYRSGWLRDNRCFDGARIV